VTKRKEEKGNEDKESNKGSHSLGGHIAIEFTAFCASSRLVAFLQTFPEYRRRVSEVFPDSPSVH
jgi:hypothetical protein